MAKEPAEMDPGEDKAETSLDDLTPVSAADAALAAAAAVVVGTVAVVVIMHGSR